MFLNSNKKTWQETKLLNADVLIIDMEDSIAYRDKAKIRAEYQKAIEEKVFDGLKLFVRLNSLCDFNEVQRDISDLTNQHVQGFVLPKVGNISDIENYEELIEKEEKIKNLASGSLKIAPIVETAGAFFEATNIARASQRISALICGSEDLKAYAFHKNYSPTYFSLVSRIVMVANLHCMQPVGGAFDKIKDLSGFINHCQKLYDCGATGVITLTPYQAILANQIFSHSPRDIEWAKKVITVKEEGAISKIRRSVWESEQMIGPPHIEQARHILKYSHLPKASQNPAFIPITCATRQNGLKDGAKVGQISQPDTQVTVTTAWRTIWDSSFPSNDVTNNATSVLYPGSNSLSSPMPFGLLMTLNAGLAVSELSHNARFHLGFYNAFQCRPVLSGDRLRVAFRIDDCNKTNSNASKNDNDVYTIVDSSHWLINQIDQVVFSFKKRTMFPNLNINESSSNKDLKVMHVKDSLHYKMLTKQPIELLTTGRRNAHLAHGQLFSHKDVNVVGETEMRVLCRLFSITNPHHHNTLKFSSNDIVVPGPFVIFATIGNTAGDLGKVIFEHIPKCISINTLNPGDQIETLTYVENCCPVTENENLEEITFKHIGIKNRNLEDLSSVPEALFQNRLVKPSDFEKMCSEECPALLGKIACYIERVVVRVRSDIKISKTWTFPSELTQS